MIQVQGISVQYRCIQALRNISFAVARGECVLVTGPSGCGKSTLARLLTGLLPQVIPATVEGSITIDGINILKLPTAVVAQKVGSVFQNPSSQLFHLKVEDEIAFGPRNLQLSGEDVNARVEWAIEAAGLQDLRLQKPTLLSGGQKQRVAIASALAMQPDVLVLDEPTASLDVSGTLQVITMIQNLRVRYGVTVILIEHRLADVYQLADRVIIMDDGQIVAEGPPRKIFSDWERLKKLGLRRPVEDGFSPWQELIRPNTNRLPGDIPLIELHNVSAGYQRHSILNDINLSIFPGEFVAIVGSNGAGKTTLALTIAGLLKPGQGKVIFKGGQKTRPGLDIGLLFQNPLDQLFTGVVEEEIAFGPMNYGRFNLELHNHVLEETDLLTLKGRQPLSLSCGQQQRLALGSILSLHPQVLILDEPSLGQDWGHLQRLMDFVTDLNQQGIVVILITHDYKLIHHYARRVILLDSGKIAIDGILHEQQKN